MSTFRIPYNRGVLFGECPDERLNGIYAPAGLTAAADASAEISRALDAPIGGASLEALAAGKRHAVIIVSDHTRPVPTRLLLPPLLARLRAASPGIRFTLLVATGCHRGSTPDELREMLGESVFREENIAVHDCMDTSQLVTVGTLPSGAELSVNRLAAEADLLIGTGFIEPHFFAGFSGGRKCILPGIASRPSVHANHCAQFIASPYARTGILEGNPIHQDMAAAARLAKLAFILNVVLDSGHHVVRAFAGEPAAAHQAGCDFLRSRCVLEVPLSDIVITSNGGYPLDQNVYQAVKGMTAGEAACRPGGVIILCASCCDGIGGEAFRRALEGMRSPQELLRQIEAVPREATTADQWQYQILARVLTTHTVIIVTQDCDHQMLRAMNLRCAGSIAEALKQAEAVTGADARISVIPDGVSVIVEAER